MATRNLKAFALLALTASLSACAVYPGGGYGYHRGGGYYGRPAVYAGPVYRGGYGGGYQGGYGYGGGHRGGGWGGDGYRGWH